MPASKLRPGSRVRTAPIALAIVCALAFAAPSALAQGTTAPTGLSGATGPTGPTAPVSLTGPIGPQGYPPPLAPPLPAPPPYAVTRPSAKTLYRYGPDGRYLMDGPWLFRFDRRGLQRHFESLTSRTGWNVVQVPDAWNGDNPTDASFHGAVGWYRKDFKLPTGDPRYAWIVRFESVNYRSRVWLNGHEISSHTGEFLPFELALPGGFLNRRGTNRLVIRVDSHHHEDDLPPFTLSSSGTPTGGWWNYGGVLREVYLRRVDTVDLSSVLVLPRIACASCTAAIDFRATVTNYARARRVVQVVATFGGRTVGLGTQAIGGGGTAIYRGHLKLAHPRLWSPLSPSLYDVTLDASAQGGGHAHYFLRSGIRSLRVVAGGLLLLNGQPVHLRGVGLQEDSIQHGFAIDNTIRQRFIAETKDLGADLIRSQYPLHPYLEELADEQGILLWSEIPVFTVKEIVLDSKRFRNFATDYLRQNILDNGSHPSVAIWSISNENSTRPEPGQIDYIREAVATAHGLDPTRPVGLAIQGYPSVPCQVHGYAPLQVLGINDYFGWYPGPSGQIADRSLLSSYLDRARACYPSKALLVTEFGAEANRNGPVQERGTYQFQSDFVDYHLGVFATKPYLSAAVYWALEEFRVRPGWSGGNPLPQSPIHNKGLISFTGFKKPAYFEVQRIYRSAKQVG